MDDPLVLTSMIAALAIGLAALAWLADRRRMRRRDLDAVGIMPWTKIFMGSALVGGGALWSAVRLWLAGERW